MYYKQKRIHCRESDTNKSITGPCVSEFRGCQAAQLPQNWRPARSLDCSNTQSIRLSEGQSCRKNHFCLASALQGSHKSYHKQKLTYIYNFWLQGILGSVVF
jgi:hypothetical protein